MKFLLATITLVIVFSMNRFQDYHSKDTNNVFTKIVYKNTTEIFHLKKEIRKFIEAFKEKQKNRTRSLNEIECTKILYEYIKNDHLSQLSNAWNTLDLIIFEEKKYLGSFEMK